MKILHINKRDSGGGAATACERLHRALLAKSVDSWILCDVPSGSVPNVLGLRKGNRRGGFLNRLQARTRFEFRKLIQPPFFVEPACHTAFSLNFTRNCLPKLIRKVKPDIVHLHWVGAGFLQVEAVQALASEFPLVWTLHDMWPFCGAEHIAYTDERWKEGYKKENRCPASKGPDLNRWVWNRKRKSWSGLKIHTVGVSRWTDECVRESRLFQKISGLRRYIHNGLDTEIFHPHAAMDDYVSQNISMDRSYRVLFGAVSQSNRIKGGDLLMDSLKILGHQQHRIELTTFGGKGITTDESIPYKNCGRIDSQLELAALYASSDVMVVPSRLETFGQVAAESLACGTPVVSFDTSGLRDIVDHKENGYRARCYDPADLAEGIRWCLDNPERHAELRRRARETALERFRIDSIAAKTTDLYEEIMSV